MKMRKGNITQNKFFALLVDFNILESTESSAGKEKLLAGDELESRRDLIDMRQRLENSSSYFYTYLLLQVRGSPPEETHFCPGPLKKIWRLIFNL